MGTRGAIGFSIDGKVSVSYNHFDSDPSSLGKDVVEFCKARKFTNEWKKFKRNAREVILVDQEKKVSKKLITKYEKFSNTSVGSNTNTDWYCLLRQLQGVPTLAHVLEGTLGHMIDSYDFLTDSLFCEFAYIIDLDNDRLLFFEGFNTDDPNCGGSPLVFKNFTPEKRGTGEKTYYPVKLVGSCPLDDIPDDWMTQFYPDEKE